MLQKEDFKNYTKDELVEMFVDLINEMEKTGYEYWNKFDQNKNDIEFFTYGGALLTRVNRIKAIVKCKNNENDK